MPLFLFLFLPLKTVCEVSRQSALESFGVIVHLVLFSRGYPSFQLVLF